MVLFLAGGRGFTRREGLRRLKERMENVPGFTAVRYEPSRLRPRSVIAAVEIELFLGAAFPRDEGKVEVQWRPRDGIDVQRVHWADEAVSLGWHKDDDHAELGTTHFSTRIRRYHRPRTGVYRSRGSAELSRNLSFTSPGETQGDERRLKRVQARTAEIVRPQLLP